MPTRCNPNLFAGAPAEGRPVVASFDGGAITYTTWHPEPLSALDAAIGPLKSATRKLEKGGR